MSVHEAEVVNVDETSWRESRRKVWLWATVTKLATVFTIAASRSREVVTALLGSQHNQSLAAIATASTSTSWRGGVRSAGRT